jgi:hypothetical protein
MLITVSIAPNVLLSLTRGCMKIIAIQDLRPVGHSLLDDEESYLSNLSSEDEFNVSGGISPTISWVVASSEACATIAAASIIATINW